MNEKYFKQVSEDDFNDFIRNYKGNLTTHLTFVARIVCRKGNEKERKPLYYMTTDLARNLM